MQVRMKIKIAGSRNGVRWPAAGTVLDLPEGEVRDLLSQDVAELVDGEEFREPGPEAVEPAPVDETPDVVETPAEEERTLPEPEQATAEGSKSGIFGRRSEKRG